uniref:MHC class I-like antigen recognition-like domain-containing protein n=1 Tax=Coturnix japonica TaxID=93934 RepID=A0A8C2TV44_COTJA
MPHSEHRAGAHGSSSFLGQDGGSSNSSKGAVWGWGLEGVLVLLLHTLRYFQTAMTDPGPELPWFFEVGYVDGEIFMHYNSTGRRYVPRTEWIKAPGAVDP